MSVLQAAILSAFLLVVLVLHITSVGPTVRMRFQRVLEEPWNNGGNQGTGTIATAAAAAAATRQLGNKGDRQNPATGTTVRTTTTATETTTTTAAATTTTAKAATTPGRNLGNTDGNTGEVAEAEVSDTTQYRCLKMYLTS